MVEKMVWIQILIANFVLVYLADLSRSISIAAAHSVANHGRLVIDGTYNKRGLPMILWLDSHFNISWWNFESRWQCVSFRRSNFHFKCSLQCSCRRASNPSIASSTMSSMWLLCRWKSVPAYWREHKRYWCEYFRYQL